jgi:hypothetical protein
MVIIKANEQSEAGVMPSEQLITEMMKFNEELVNSGIMLAGDGLHPSSKGKRVVLGGDEPEVIDGPFAETKELIAGYWVWQVDSMEHAIDLVKRIPDTPDNPTSGERNIIEIRPIFEADDFGDAYTEEARAIGEELDRKMQTQS